MVEETVTLVNVIPLSGIKNAVSALSAISIIYICIVADTKRIA